MRKRTGRVQAWLDLGEQAIAALNRARNACSSAQTNEVMDAFTSNKAISVMSTMSTNSAKAAVRDAKQAVESLVKALPKRADVAEVDAPDDLMDLALDLVFDIDFDILSLFNISALGDAARRCDEVAERLAPLVAQLQATAANMASRLDAEEVTLRGMESPFIAKAAESVPPTLRGTMPAQLFEESD